MFFKSELASIHKAVYTCLIVRVIELQVQSSEFDTAVHAIMKDSIHIMLKLIHDC